MVFIILIDAGGMVCIEDHLQVTEIIRGAGWRDMFSGFPRFLESPGIYQHAIYV